MRNLHLLLTTIFLFGMSAFFRKLSVDRIHPYQLQIVAGAVYALEVPVWLYLISRQSIVGYDIAGVAYGVLCILTHVIAAVLVGVMMKGSQDPGMLSTMIAMSPAVTMMLSVTFLGEQFTLKKAVASAVMLTGLYLFNR